MNYKDLPKKKQKLVDLLRDCGWTFNSYPGHKQSICFDARCYIYLHEIKDMEIADVFRAVYNSGLSQGFAQGRNSLAAQYRHLLENPNESMVILKAEDLHLKKD